MKKSCIVFSILASVLMFAGCQATVEIQEEPNPHKSRISKIFTAIFEKQETKVGFSGEYSFLQGYFAVFPGYTTGHRYTFKDFTQYLNGGPVELVEDFNEIQDAVIVDENPIPGNVAVYPYRRAIRESDGLSVCGRTLSYDSETGLYTTQLEWPFEEENPVVAATSSTEDTEFKFKNTIGLLHIPVKGDGLYLKKVDVRGNDNEVFNGVYRITFGPETLPTFTCIEERQGTSYREVNEYLNLTTATDVYFTFPAMVFEKGITVAFYTDLGIIEKSTTKRLEITRSAIQPMAELTLEPVITATEISYKSSDGQIVQPARLQAWGRNNEELTYTNTIENEVGVIRFSGIATLMDVSFNSCSNLQSIESLNNTIKLTPESGPNLFNNCTNLQDISFFEADNTFNMSEITDATSMFEGCVSLNDCRSALLAVNNLQTAKRMFKGCTSITEICNGYGFNISGTDATEMFYGCTSIEKLEIFGITTDQNTDMTGMFANCGIYYIVVYEAENKNTPITETTFENVPMNGAIACMGSKDVFYDWIGSGYNWSYYNIVLDGQIDRWSYASVLWITDFSGPTYKLSGKDVALVRTGVFAKADYDADPVACRTQVETSGTLCSSDELEAINGDGKSMSLGNLSDESSYVLVVYYEGVGMYGRCRKETYSISFTTSANVPSSIEYLTYDNNSNGSAYWQ